MSLTTYLTEVAATLTTDMPVFKTVAIRGKHQAKTIKTPAAFVSLADEFEKAPELGDGIINVTAELQVLVLYAKSIDKTNLKTQQLALEVAQKFNSKKPANTACKGVLEFLRVEPASFEPEYDKYAAYYVIFNHTLIFGESILDDTEYPSVEVKVSQSPDIGIPNEPKYEKL